MRNIALFSIFFSSAAFGQVQVQVGVDADNDQDSYQVDTWYGPGWYYGFYFGSDYEYWNWRHNNPNWWDYHHQYYHGHQDHYHQDRSRGANPAPQQHDEEFHGGGGRGGGHGGGHGR